MWIILHAIFWDGKASNVKDVMDSLQTPGQFKYYIHDSSCLDILIYYLCEQCIPGVKIELSGGESPNRRNEDYYKKPYPESFYQFSSPDDQNLNQDNAQDRISLDSVNTLINVSF